MRGACALVALNLVWRTVRYAAGFPLWGDEAFLANNFLLRDFRGMVAPLDHGQIAPLGFMWAQLAVARVLGASEHGLRLLPYLAGVGSMLLFWRFARRVFDRWSALLAVAVFAAAYYPVRHAAEVKPYAWDLFVSLVLTAAAWSVIERPRSSGRWALLLAAAAVAPWVSYPSLFVAGAVGLALLYTVCRRRGEAPLAGPMAYGLVLALSAVPMILFYAQPHAEAAAYMTEIRTWRNAFPPVRQPWRLPAWFIQIHTGNMLAYPVGGKNFSSSATFLLVVVGGVVVWRRRRDLLLLLLSPLPLNFVAAAFKRYPYGTSARVSLYMAPALCLLAGAGALAVLKACLRRRVARGALAAAFVVAAIPVAGIASDLIWPYKTPPDWGTRRAVRWLADQTRPADRWVVFLRLSQSGVAPDLYRRGGHAARCRFYVLRLAPVPVAWGDPPDSIRPPPGGRVWLMVHRDGDYPFPEGSLDSYLEVLSRRLGRFRRHSFDLGDAEAMEIYEFPAPETVADR